MFFVVMRWDQREGGPMMAYFSDCRWHLHTIEKTLEESRYLRRAVPRRLFVLDQDI